MCVFGFGYAVWYSSFDKKQVAPEDKSGNQSLYLLPRFRILVKGLRPKLMQVITKTPSQPSLGSRLAEQQGRLISVKAALPLS